MLAVSQGKEDGYKVGMEGLSEAGGGFVVWTGAYCFFFRRIGDGLRLVRSDVCRGGAGRALFGRFRRHSRVSDLLWLRQDGVLRWEVPKKVARGSVCR